MIHIPEHVLCKVINSRTRRAGSRRTYGGEGKCVRLLLRKPERKRPLGRPRRSWEDNININLKEIGFVGMGWINLAQDRDKWRAVLNTAMNHWVV